MGTRLYVGNLSFGTTENALRAAFEQDGRSVVEVKVVTDRDTGQPRGFAFVEMSSPADAESAISSLDGHMLDGRTLKVNMAQERPAGGGRGGFGGGGGGGGRGGFGGGGGGGDGGGRGGRGGFGGGKGGGRGGFGGGGRGRRGG
ncbi:MAG: RNA-binding protein [Deltaproteobacteria bacterium]|nr:RNA-binding protein [Deltaproteobacteria bacterium]